jgi:hypothetical protein
MARKVTDGCKNAPCNKKLVKQRIIKNEIVAKKSQLPPSFMIFTGASASNRSQLALYCHYRW